MSQICHKIRLNTLRADGGKILETARNTGAGGLIIAEDVIASIAQNAAKDILGVVGFATKPADFKGLFKSFSSSPKAVRVQTRDGEMVIDIRIIVKQGRKITDVAAEVQFAVKQAVQTMTGQIVAKVNCVVESLQSEPV
jgi:uncharacterized alkaline shock family protein YloU